MEEGRADKNWVNFHKIKWFKRCQQSYAIILNENNFKKNQDSFLHSKIQKISIFKINLVNLRQQSSYFCIP